MTEGVRVLIAVATFDRNEELLECLESLVGLNGEFDVLVVDNNPDGGARAVVSAHRLAPRYLHEMRPGISAARNAALDYAARYEYEWLAFVDDDELVDPDWLSNGLHAAEQFSADVVTGPAVPVLAETRGWVANAGFFRTPSHPTGTVAPVAATNNVFISRRWWKDRGFRFSNAFAGTGGEDTEFFARVVAEGGRIVWCEEAVVVDRIPASRIRWSWVARRATRNGQVSARIALKYHGTTKARVLLLGIARVLYGGFRVCVRLVTFRRLRAADVWPLLRGVGWVRVVLGRTINEYRPANPDVGE